MPASYREILEAPTLAERRAVWRRLRAPGYRGSTRIAQVMAVTLVPAVLALWHAGPWGWKALGAAVGAVLVGASVVYFSHRFPMHHPMRGLGLLYDLHTRCHHMVFREGQTEIESIDDVDMVMMPWREAAAIGWVLAPLLTVPWWLVLGTEAALVYYAVAVLYYLAYELVHLASHLRVGGPLDRVPVLGWLLRHHRRHHAWAVMHHGNFSMLIPLWDWLLGTLVTGPRETSGPR
ncbi:sterol desaturase family protein [Paraliomyxa miuraensis]|uniref:sterol desaturase family protein n=1 Tax=Paraliomyxa miuraensis TaxID=376150 RepID=UPI00224C9926|nr:sterol desaturase family protein [Paraliomyxa miuraensis]MCX4240459.1 sterol desaturase family protein [Paraliomyxa miuraensis]